MLGMLDQERCRMNQVGLGGRDHPDRTALQRLYKREHRVLPDLASGDPAGIQREAAVGAPPDPNERERRGILASGQVRLERGDDDRGLRGARAARMAVEPLEEVGLRQDRGPLERRHMRAYIPRWTPPPRLPYPRPSSSPPPGADGRASTARQGGPDVNRFEPNLRIPGPTHLPPSVREAGGRQMINHRGPEFAALLARIDRRMRVFFGTQQEVLLLTAAGTGGLEAAIVNVLSPGDRVLALPTGAFGDRFAIIASVYGADVMRLETEWGQAAEPAALRAHLALDADYRAVLLTHNETSTGVTNPIAELAATVHELAPDALVLVDGVSALGAVPFEMDAWGLDVVVTGSQKAWMAAPGMSMIALSERAWAAAEAARMPRFYFDIRDARKSAATGQTPWTPAVAVMYQVDAGLELMEAETAAWVPDDLDWKAFNGEVKARQVVLAGGQGKLKGRIFRVGHLGAVNLDDILGAIGVLEEVALAFGRPVEPGAAVAAAQRAILAAAGSRPVTAGVPA